MNSKKLAGAGAAVIGATTAVAALLLGATAAVATEARPDSAYGLAATGILPIAPVPYVESADGQQVEDQLVGLGDVLGPDEDDLAVGVLTVEARAGAAESVVTEVNLPSLLHADVVRTFCADGRGGLQIVRGSVLGHALPETPIAGQTLDLAPLARVTLGRQTHNTDGSLTVTGIEVSVLPGADRGLDEALTGEERKALPALGGLLGADLAASDTVGELVAAVPGARGAGTSGSLQTITIGSATCNPSDHDRPDHDRPDPDKPADGDAPAVRPDAKDVPQAPRPTIVDADLPVTG